MNESMDKPSGAGLPVSGQSAAGQSALLICLLSGWLAVSLFAWFTANVTFEVLSIKKTPEISEKFSQIPEARRGRLLRRTAGAINRKMFRGWNVAQLLVGLLVLGLISRERGRGVSVYTPTFKYLAAGVFAVVLAHVFWLGPGIEQTGRLLDAPDAKLAAEASQRFGMYHGIYVVSDLLKAALLGWLIWAAYSRRVRPETREG